MGRFDFRLDLRKITTPMLVLAGRYDPDCVSSLDHSVQTLRTAAKVRDVGKERTFPFVEQSEETMRGFRDFLHKQQEDRNGT
jgi:pimeloyl-ACP methyl ester carboxylesterase